MPRGGEASPAVERALRRAAELAERDRPTAGDMFRALTEDPDGRPAAWLTQHQWDGSPVDSDEDCPADDDLLTAAARYGSPPTTDGLLRALLAASPGLGKSVRAAGVALPAEEEPAGDEFEPIELRESATAQVARVLDVNLNRAREGLRVLDDYCRFALNDAALTERVKSLRHDLVEWMKRVPESLLLDSRDTPGDVGTAITTQGEAARGSAAEVAAVNLRRVQESLRSLEEFAKTFDSGLAVALERLRYDAYALQSPVTRAAAARSRLAGVRLYVLFGSESCRLEVPWAVREAAAGGADMVQLREKGLSDKELLIRAEAAAKAAREAGALFIVNDRPDIASLVAADGVHLGQGDLPVGHARRVLGPDAVVGVSTHTPEQVEAAVAAGADYIGVGPTFPSRTKSFGELAGLDFVRRAAGMTSLPAFAIGGIDAANISEVFAAGAGRVAVSAAVASSDDPRREAAVLRAAFPEGHVR